MTAEKLSRRSFFRLAGGGIAAAVIAPKLLLEKVINIPVEFGWTWYVDRNNVPSTLSNLVAETLRANTQKIAENVTANNTLLMKLNDGTKINLQIEQISEEAQNQRIKTRMQNRHEEKIKNRIKKLDNYNQTEAVKRRKEQYEKILRGESIYDNEDPKVVWARADKLRQDIEDGKIPHPLAKWKRHGTA